MEHWRSGYLSTDGPLTENVGSGAPSNCPAAYNCDTPLAKEHGTVSDIVCTVKYHHGPSMSNLTALFNLSLTWFPVINLPYLPLFFYCSPFTKPTTYHTSTPNDDHTAGFKKPRITNVSWWSFIPIVEFSLMLQVLVIDVIGVFSYNIWYYTIYSTYGTVWTVWHTVGIFWNTFVASPGGFRPQLLQFRNRKHVYYYY